MMNSNFFWIKDEILESSLQFRAWIEWILQIPQLVMCFIQIIVKSPIDILSGISKMDSLCKFSVLQKYKESSHVSPIMTSRAETMKIIRENNATRNSRKARRSSGHSSIDPYDNAALAALHRTKSGISIDDKSLSSE